MYFFYTWLKVSFQQSLVSKVTVLKSFSGKNNNLKTPTFIPIKYEVIKGYFYQDDPSSIPSDFNYLVDDFGLIAPNTWNQVKFDLKILNDNSPDNVAYKLLFLARHGEAPHNAAKIYYGQKAWDCYWAHLPGNRTMTWLDGHLTELGTQQAKDNNPSWKKQLTKDAPFPSSFYCSPLTRSIETLIYTWNDIGLFAPPYVHPVFKEMLREDNGVDTADIRMNKTYLSKVYPEFEFEDGFSEEDELWDPYFYESNEAHDVRSHRFLDDIFANDSSAFISVTSHSGTIYSIFRVIGHADYIVDTGGMVPVIVKAIGPSIEGTSSSRTGLFTSSVTSIAATWCTVTSESIIVTATSNPS
ncbi:histidine phosphatase family protein [Ascoidea rubescens DSM 1968]|uniref:Phosphoglycerate mutase-like protein n=1 Tax=Ascoidea rubescens DSM 1968 TaxID=1344418 RepID=A0A1D2VQ71_9ASCO|nr:phosphoglycerate mutase-like protein [Ascoidea rubescens DSM 1968]ODV63772.1 phosphoglycerate mutase-like protein [Ascoidea rubescens DSM 1968]